MLRRFPGSAAALSLVVLVLALGATSALVVPEAGSSPTLQLPSLADRPVPPSTGPAVSGRISAPGGPYLYDRSRRVVFFHGVDAVYKHPPFELYPAPGKPWNLSAADASLMARLGFNVVRLGMTWSGLEPGTAPANDPAICDPGPPSNPHQFNRAVFDRYIGHLRTTVNLLGRYHIYTILDMHQDVYNEMFDGEGVPNWAVCTNGVTSVDPPGRWSLSYGTRAAGIAYHHFWTNDVRGDLQGEFDRMWGLVAHAFRGNRWILGYDPFNEPFSTSLILFGDAHFDAQLECFYTGRDHMGSLLHGAPPIRCPAADPANGVIPTLQANDPGRLVFDEPDNYASRGFPTYLGPMNLPNLVFNVHVYCGARSPVTGNPTDVLACVRQDLHSLDVRARDRLEMASGRQRGGPAWFVTEFGASSNPDLLAAATAKMDAEQVGWAYWAWRYYGDPTGSADESLVMADGRLRSTALVLSRAYPQAVAGVPLSFAYAPLSDVFTLTYRPDHAIRAPTVVFVPTAVHYRRGYCARVSGGRVTSRRGSDQLDVQSSASARQVTVRVTPGSCAGHPGSGRRV